MKKNFLYLLIVAGCLQSCKKVEDQSNALERQVEVNDQIEIKYAKGFQIETTATGYKISIRNPWPESAERFTFELLHAKDDDFWNSNNVSNAIHIPIKSIVLTSTTHIPPLVLLNEEKSLKGFPSTDYISAPEVRTLIEDGKVEELGANETMNVERTIMLAPDLVMGFSIDASNPVYQKIEKVGIPVIYNGEWVEKHPLAKAEWIKLFGVLYGKEQQADSIFQSIENEYLNTLELVKNVKRPKVISGATWKEQWYLPYGDSWQGKILNDAGANYIYQETTGTGSLAYNIEKVLVDGNDAAFWIAPAQYTSYSKMIEDNKSYQLFDAFKNKQVYTHALTVGAKGGVTYYEEASMRPDLVLKDLVKILHPELEMEHELYFFKPLKE
ncbi:iron complex transport system substrate-binding protein [Nonlabens dokdonensis]|jgi:iron complex transport system substrate-binding protein|uniref:Iron complex transport system substrate-binding protein n=2 Tax=Nonlabens dokdonensis TaxID=328515 RepID=A0ABX5PV94_9FLAO|nr:ABC transporter substrate-binding protein [Nonlabens dokdonensis]AGC78366.1 putative iron(III) ABC transporter periplasmic iron-binding protein [Nonlabens dokdonensis DSW-6]PZX38118.1 iron complex transport system substrate-binding protein [Nonlabens dokdonensis]